MAIEPDPRQGAGDDKPESEEEWADRLNAHLEPDTVEFKVTDLTEYYEALIEAQVAKSTADKWTVKHDHPWFGTPSAIDWEALRQVSESRLEANPEWVERFPELAAGRVDYGELKEFQDDPVIIWVAHAS